MIKDEKDKISIKRFVGLLHTDHLREVFNEEDINLFIDVAEVLRRFVPKEVQLCTAMNFMNFF